MTLAGHVDALLGHTSPRLVDIVLANDRFDARVPDDWNAEVVRLDWPPARRLRRGSSSTRSSTPTMPTTTTLSGWPRRSCGPTRRPSGRSAADSGPHGMTASDRDLVVALRNELAAIDPARPCDRASEAAGLEGAIPGREPAVSRLVVRLGRDRAAVARRSTGTSPPSTAGWPGCAAASWPVGR